MLDVLIVVRNLEHTNQFLFFGVEETHASTIMDKKALLSIIDNFNVFSNSAALLAERSHIWSGANVL